MKHLKIFEEFSPIVDNIFYKFAYPGQPICKKGFIYDPNTNACIPKLNFINDLEIINQNYHHSLIGHHASFLLPSGLRSESENNSNIDEYVHKTQKLQKSFCSSYLPYFVEVLPFLRQLWPHLSQVRRRIEATHQHLPMDRIFTLIVHHDCHHSSTEWRH